MYTYEYFNQKVDERNAAAIKEQQNKTLMVLVRVLSPVAIALTLIAILHGIGFINNIFCACLMLIVLCNGSFRLGRVWHKVKF